MNAEAERILEVFRRRGIRAGGLVSRGEAQLYGTASKHGVYHVAEADDSAIAAAIRDAVRGRL